MIYAFDLDSTLCPPSESSGDEVARLLRSLEANGSIVAIASGKPVAYLCGFARQAGLTRPALIGENGCVLSLGISPPPELYRYAPISEAALRQLSEIRRGLEGLFPRKMWFQQNERAVTPYPVTTEEFDAVRRYLDRERESGLIDVYEQSDTFDVLPRGISKKTGLAELCAVLGVPPADVTAAGDGANDFPMFGFAGFSVGLTRECEGKADVIAPDIITAINLCREYAKTRC